MIDKKVVEADVVERYAPSEEIVAKVFVAYVYDGQFVREEVVAVIYPAGFEARQYKDEEANGIYARDVEAEFRRYKLDEALGINAVEVDVI